MFRTLPLLLTLFALLAALAMPVTVFAQADPFDSGSTTGGFDDFSFDDADMTDDFEFEEDFGDGFDEAEWNNQLGPGAQFGPGGPGGAPNEEFVAMMLAVYGTVIVIAIVVGLVISAIICWLISASLGCVPEEMREMSTGQVWLLMIPCFSIVWAFFVAQRVPRSFLNYFNSVGNSKFGDCGAQLGLWWAICLAASIIPCVNYIAGPAQLVLLIIFIVKLWSMKGEIERGVAMGETDPLGNE